jgi:hypothetical protein
MQNAKCKIENGERARAGDLSFLILHFAFCIFLAPALAMPDFLTPIL